MNETSYCQLQESGGLSRRARRCAKQFGAWCRRKERSSPRATRRALFRRTVQLHHGTLQHAVTKRTKGGAALP